MPLVFHSHNLNPLLNIPDLNIVPVTTVSLVIMRRDTPAQAHTSNNQIVHSWLPRVRAALYIIPDVRHKDTVTFRALEEVTDNRTASDGKLVLDTTTIRRPI